MQLQITRKDLYLIGLKISASNEWFNNKEHASLSCQKTKDMQHFNDIKDIYNW